jgi:CheY-like chemotaxis protein
LPPAGKTPAITVLFIEDSAGDALLTSQILAEFVKPVKLVIARDGEQALIMLSDPTFEPTLIILDLNLPRVSGFEVLEKNPRKEIPVVVFSVSSNPADAQRALTLGAREFITKPIDMIGYKNVVQGMIQKWAVPKSNGAANKG